MQFRPSILTTVFMCREKGARYFLIDVYRTNENGKNNKKVNSSIEFHCE